MGRHPEGMCAERRFFSSGVKGEPRGHEHPGGDARYSADAEEGVRHFTCHVGHLVQKPRYLANDSRLRLLHALERAGELSVTDLASEVEMTTQAVSNQLQRLVDRRILVNRREGSRLIYRIADPCVKGLLDLGSCLLEETRV